ncbi:MAG: nucleoside deaminase [Armatimonadetes bacterium]|nr:nucleoside deaminase [Armatimonadota bacterium]
MRLAIAQAREGIQRGQTPFGACIVRDGVVVAGAHNAVWAHTDITAHAEIEAIRAACRALGTVDLSGCTIYSTCEPCPMCFSACHWANLDRIVYGATIADAARAGFRELAIPNEQMKSYGQSTIQLTSGVLHAECAALFEEWGARPDRRSY